MSIVVVALAAIAFLSGGATGASRQCFKCRSRGELGDCRDPFPYNGTTGQGQPGLSIQSNCVSGWCYKRIEGINGPPDDFGTAMERGCLQLAPSDGEERCAEIRTALMCFCKGNLCNTSSQLISNWITPLVCVLGVVLRFR